VKCRNCKQTLTNPARRPFEVWCSSDCAVAIWRAKEDKKQAQEARRTAQETRKRKEALKTRKEWMADALRAFCAWVRKRDEGKPCISCGTHGGQRHGGHFRDTFHYASLAFEPDGCWAQCAQCNAPPPMGKGGNLINYRLGLIGRIGEDRVKELESHQPTKKYTIPELKSIRDDYRNRLKS